METVYQKNLKNASPQWAFRRLIVRAAPTCTLWVADLAVDVLRFRFYRRWYITSEELMETAHGV